MTPQETAMVELARFLDDWRKRNDLTRMDVGMLLAAQVYIRCPRSWTKQSLLQAVAGWWDCAAGEKLS